MPIPTPPSTGSTCSSLDSLDISEPLRRPPPSLDSPSLVRQRDTSPFPPPPTSYPSLDSLSILTPPSSTRSSLDSPSSDSVHHFVTQIRNFLSHPNHHRLTIENVTKDQYNTIDQLLGEGRHQFWYNTASKSVVVKAPPSKMQVRCRHILDVVENAVDQATRRGGFTCRIRAGSTGTLDIYDHTNCVFLKRKEANCLKIHLNGVRQPRLLYLIFEIGSLESHPEMVDDARAWLMDYDKEVLAVILIKVLRQPGLAKFNLNGWKGFAEVWERDPSHQNIQQFGGRVDFLPPVLGTSAALPLRLNHTIPQYLLPSHLKDAMLSIGLDEVVEECSVALEWMEVCDLKKKRSDTDASGQ